MTNRTATTAAIILSLTAAGAPAASARPADVVPAGKQPPATAYSRPDKSLIPVAARTAAGPTATASPLGRPNLDQTSTKAAGNTASAYAALTLTGKTYVPAPTMTGAPNAVAPTLTGRPYAPAPTLTGKPYPGSPMVGANAHHQSASNATAVHSSGGTAIWALIGLGVAAGIALIAAGAAASQRPSRRTARARAVSGS